MSGFNPYRDWLKLSVDSDHPDYYELLELAPQECREREQVVAAAKRQLERLKSLEGTPNRVALKKLVDEIKAAARCLSSLSARNEYDAALRSMASVPALAHSFSADDLIPTAIPLAIPIVDPCDTAEVPVLPEDMRANDSMAVQESATDFRRAADRKTKKPKSTSLFWLGQVTALAAAIVAALLLRPDLREFFSDGTASRPDPVGTAPGLSDNPKKPALVSGANKSPARPDTKTPAPSKTPKPDDNLVKDNGRTFGDSTSGDPEKTEVGDPPVSDKPMTTDDLMPSAIDKPGVALAAVDAVNISPMPDAAVDFYARSIIALLAVNDIEMAVEFYSRLDSDAISDQRLDMFLRLGSMANSYTMYREWLRDCAGKIPGGTSLEVGEEKLPIGIVEASREFIIFRDRGTNFRYPLEVVPNAVSWSIIEQMRPGDPLTPILKLLVRSIKNWNQPESIEQTIAAVNAYDPPDSDSRKTKEAILGWLQTDRALLLGEPESVTDLQDVGFAEAMEQVTAQYSAAERSEDAIHDWIRAAFMDANPLSRVAQLEYAKRAAVERSNVSLAVCISLELSRFMNPEVALEEKVKLIKELGNLELDRREGSRLMLNILRLVNDSDKPMNAAQAQTVLRVASRIMAKQKLDNFSDAVQKAAARK